MRKRTAAMLVGASMLLGSSLLLAGILAVNPSTGADEATVSSAARDITARCISDGPTSDAENCVQESLDLLSGTRGYAFTSRVLQRVTQDNRSTAGWFCHTIAHNLGAEVALEAPKEPLLDWAPYFCFGGIWHGYLEKRGEVLNVEDYLAQAKDTCASLIASADPGAIQRFDCVHGVGHGLGMNPEATLTTALATCALFNTPEDTYACASGVASAYAHKAVPNDPRTAGSSTQQALPNDAKWPAVIDTCNAQDETPIAEACWERAAAFSYAAGIPDDELVTECSRASKPRSCAKSLGIRAVLATDPASAKEAETTCHQFPTPSLIRGCLEGNIWITTPILVAAASEFTPCPTWNDKNTAWCTATVNAYRARESAPYADLARQETATPSQG